jgi:hypothetical protein
MNRNYSNPRENEYLQEEYDAHLRNSIIRKYHCSHAAAGCGVQVDYAKNLYHKLIKVKNREEKAISDFCESYTSEVSRELRSTFQFVLGSKSGPQRTGADSTSAIKPRTNNALRIYPDFEDISLKIMTILKTVGCANVLQTSHELFVEQLGRAFGMKCPDQNNIDLAKMIALDGDITRAGHQMISISSLGKEFRVMLWSLVLILAVLFGSVNQNETIIKIESSSFMQHLHDNILDDVPQTALDNLVEVLRECIGSGSVVALESTGAAAGAGSHAKLAITGKQLHFELISARANLERYVQRINSKKKFPVITLNYALAMMTATLLVFRVRQLEEATVGCDEITGSRALAEVPLHINAEVSSSLKSIETVDKSQSPGCFACAKLLLILSTTEKNVVNAKALPAFECFKRGSFLQYMLKAHPSLMVEVFQTLQNQFCVMKETKLVERSIHEAVCEEHNFKSNPVEQGGIIISDVPMYSDSFLESKIKELIEEIMFDNSSENILTVLNLAERNLLSNLNETSNLFACVSGGLSFLQFLQNCIDRDSAQFDQLLHWNSSSVKEEQPAGDLNYYPASEDLVEFIVLCLLLTENVHAWPSRDALTEHIRSLVAEFYNCPPSAVNSLASRISQRLCDKQLVTLRSGNDRFHLTAIDVSAQNLSGIVALDQTSRTTLVVDATSDLSNYRTRMAEMALKLLMTAPFGQSCKEYCNWSSLEGIFVDTAEKAGSFHKFSVVDLIASNQGGLKRLDPSGLRFFCIIGSDDCIPLPLSPPSARDVSSALQQKDFSIIAAWLAASKQSTLCSNEGELLEFLRLEFLTIMQSNGQFALEKLLEVALETTISMCWALQHVILTVLCGIIGNVMGNISLATLFSSPVFEKLFLRSKYSSSLVRLASLYGHLSNLAPLTGMLSKFDVESAASYSSRNSYQPMLGAAATVPVATVTKLSSPETPSDILSVAGANSFDRSPTTTEIALSDDVHEGRAFVARLLQTRFSQSKDSAFGIMLQNSLNKLSEDLYSSDVHFVSELVQNADDNKYEADAEATPTLNMVLYPKALEIYNNEDGFTPENIDAIANISASTKVNKTGYIGQKGIGFKSVFTVSDSPEIHSKGMMTGLGLINKIFYLLISGFHIKFDKDFKVRPIWIDDQLVWPCKDIDGTYYETCIRLNLDARTQQSHLKLTENLKDIFDERLMLFLNNLRCIKLEDRLSNTFKQHTKHVLTSNWRLVTAKHGILPHSSSVDSPEARSYWCVVTDTFKPSVKRLHGMNDIFPTTVALALKFKELSTVQGASSARTSLVLDNTDSVQPIYSFLPTKCAWFKFVVQGDFNLVSSRERIAEDNEWNIQLLRRVPEIFVKLVEDLSEWLWNCGKASSSNHILDQLSAKFDLQFTFQDLLSLLPAIPTNIDKIYSVLVSHMYSLLQRVSFLPSTSKGLCKPSELVDSSQLHFDIATLVPEASLQAVTGLRYLSREIDLTDKLLTSLRIKSFDVQIIVECIEQYGRQLSEGDSCNIGLMAGFLLALALVANPNVVKPPQAQSSLGPRRTMNPGTRLVPSQVIIQAMPAAVAALSRDMAARLARCPVWPDLNSRVWPIDSNILWIAPEKDMLSPDQMRCVELFSDRLSRLNNGLFDAAEKIYANGGVILRSFLTKTFRPNGSDKVHCGGIESLTEENILNNIIIKSYSSASEVTNRRTSAAFLAFCFLSKSVTQSIAAGGTLTKHFQTLRRDGAYIPVVTLSNSDSKNLVWKNSSVVRVGGVAADTIPDLEVHLGPEFKSSVTAVLTNANCANTALTQLRWTVVDPLVCVLAGGQSQQMIDALLSRSDSDDVSSIKISHQKVLSLKSNDALMKFLVSIGVVDLFSPYKVEGSFHAPHLFRVLDHFIRYGVNCMKQELGPLVSPSNAASPGCCSDDMNALDIYLPDTASNNEVLGVTIDVFRTLQVL